jgi:hypothetical protein
MPNPIEEIRAERERSDREFKAMTRDLDKDHLLLLADKAISMALNVLHDMQENEAGDAFEFTGSMNEIEDARQAIDWYKGYLITGQK